MIPKIIHYCWFGGNELPESAIKCIESWKKYMPDYEIKEWNESNYDVSSCKYSMEAYLSKKWAFVSDYARFDILYKHGGVYFDTDVELVKPIDDIIERGPYMGCEPDLNENVNKASEIMVAPGLGMAANPQMKLYEIILNNYGESSFIKEDGEMDLTTVVDRTTLILDKYGFNRNNTDDIQNILGVDIYPSEYFCPLNYRTGQCKITENTRSIHQYGMSWIDGWYRNYIEIEKKYAKKFGKNISKRIAQILTLPQRTVSVIKSYVNKKKRNDN